MTPELIEEFIKLPRDKDRAIAWALTYILSFQEVALYFTDPYLTNFVKARMTIIDPPINAYSVGGTAAALRIARLALSIVTNMPVEEVMTHMGTEYLTDFVKYRLDKENAHAKTQVQ